MATILKPVRLVNPGKRKRRLTARQKLFFGSKRQRAAVSRTLGRKNPSKKGFFGERINRKQKKARTFSQYDYHQKMHKARIAKRKTRSLLERVYSGLAPSRQSSRLPNVGEIITIRPLVNSGTSKRKGTRKRRNPNNMAKSAKRRAAGLKAARTRKRNKAARSHSRRSSHRRRSNPGVRVVHRRRRRRSNPSVMRTTRRRYVRHTRRRVGRRRNPGFTSGIGGSFGKIVGVIGGAMLTKTLVGMVPAQFTTGILGYATIGFVAYAQGKAVGKLLKNPTLGNDMALGGYVYLALKVANDYFPSLGLGLSGLGLIGGTSFYTPQVNQPGSMGRFILPAAVAGAIPPAAVGGGMRGLGAGSSVRRVGRLR